MEARAFTSHYASTSRTIIATCVPQRRYSLVKRGNRSFCIPDTTSIVTTTSVGAHKTQDSVDIRQTARQPEPQNSSSLGGQSEAPPTSSDPDNEKDASFMLGFEGAEESGDKQVSSPLLASLSLAGIALLIGGGYFFRGHIKTFLEFFIQAVDDWGPLGYLAYAAVYTGLEVLAVPAIPLTMTAGMIFGPYLGTLMVSASGTVAATIAFLIARYAARDKVLQFAQKNPKFAAIDRAIGRDGLKFVTLLRLSPLLPLAASNYLYGLTSVDLGSYVLGSWLGMLPGTYAYVGAGHVGKAVFMEGEGSLSVEMWQVGVGIGVTLIALGFVGQLAKKAIEEVEAENSGGGI